MDVESLDDLQLAVGLAWQGGWPLTLLGGGSNVLISDRGVRGLVLVNRCRAARFDFVDGAPGVWAESGANFGLLARQAAQRGWKIFDEKAKCTNCHDGRLLTDQQFHNVGIGMDAAKFVTCL